MFFYYFIIYKYLIRVKYYSDTLEIPGNTRSLCRIVDGNSWWVSLSDLNCLTIGASGLRSLGASGTRWSFPPSPPPHIPHAQHSIFIPAKLILTSVVFLFYFSLTFQTFIWVCTKNVWLIYYIGMYCINALQLFKSMVTIWHSILK